MDRSQLLLWGIVSIHAFLFARVGVLVLSLSKAPPRVRERRRAPWFLHLPQFGWSAWRLRRLGFLEIGAQEEVCAITIPSRVFYSAQHRTYARIWSCLLIPRVTFSTGFESGTILHGLESTWSETGALVDRLRRSRIERRLEAHLAEVKALDLAKDRPRARGRVSESIAMSQRFYSECAAHFRWRQSAGRRRG